MKALSILQPWATLIVSGAKDVENRTWPTGHRGPMLVHAGKRFSRDELESALYMLDGAIVDHRIRDIEASTLVAMKDALQGRAHAGTDGIEFKRGGVIGIVDVVDCVKNHHSPWAIPTAWHWVLANPRPLPFHAVTGALGLFNVVGVGEAA